MQPNPNPNLRLNCTNATPTCNSQDKPNRYHGRIKTAVAAARVPDNDI